MAKVIYVPDQHSCYTEFAALEPLPFGSIVECSCGKRYVKGEDQRDGPYWKRA